MIKRLVIEPIINYDGILSTDERKKILKRIESAFCWLGADIPEFIEINGKKFHLILEIQNLIMKNELTSEERNNIESLISLLEEKEKGLIDLIKTEDMSDIRALELSNRICGILRAVHELRELIEKASKSEVLNAKQDLLKKVEDTKRWLKYLEKLK